MSQPQYPNQPYQGYNPQPDAPRMGHLSGCPNCRQLDQVQKVSAIVSSGITTKHSSKIGFGVSATLLAQRLSPPVKPRFRVSVLYLYAGVCIFLGVTLFLIYNRGLGMAMFVIGGVTIAYASAYASTLKKKWFTYEKAIAKWSDLYFCSRCDGVFTAQSNFVPAGYMNNFLNQ